jgi:hypothetical protein
MVRIIRQLVQKYLVYSSEHWNGKAHIGMLQRMVLFIHRSIGMVRLITIVRILLILFRLACANSWCALCMTVFFGGLECV